VSNKIKIKQRVKIYLFFFVLFSAITIFVNIYDTGIGFLKYSDIPNHFFGGMVVAIPLFVWVFPKIDSRKNKFIATVLYISVIGFGWEMFEIIAFESGLFLGTLFEETAENKFLDLTLGLLGFISSAFIENKSKKPLESLEV
jgi:hypothetical protein